MIRLAAVAVLGPWLSLSALAQQAVPPGVEPGQVQKRIPSPALPEPPAAPLELPAPAPAAPLAAPEFVLTGVVTEGVTAYPDAALAPLYEDYLARKVGLREVEQILSRITAKYRADGYFLSRAIALPQSLGSGVLRITVVEGYVERVSLVRARSGDERVLRSLLADVTGRRPLRLVTLERAILLIDDLPGVHAAPSLRALDDTNGAYELTLTIDYHDVKGFASIDNRGPDSLGPWEAQIAGSASSLLLPFDRLQLSLFSVPDRPRELVSAGASYDLPLGTQGTRVALSATRTQVRPEGNLTPLELDGLASRYIARLSQPLIRTRTQSLWLSGTLDSINSRENEQGSLLFNDRLRVLRAGLGYSSNDDFGGANEIAFEASQGLTVLDASSPGAGDLSRSIGRPDFTKVTGSLTRTQTLNAQWGVQLAVAGQKAVQPLLIPEQFALGGASFGRGYDPAEITGDDGLTGSLELRYGRFTDSRFLRSYQVYAFYDFGAVWNMAVSDATRRETLASVGGGIRTSLPRDIAASLEIARPLTRLVAAENGKPVRVFLSLSAPF